MRSHISILRLRKSARRSTQGWGTIEGMAVIIVMVGAVLLALELLGPKATALMQAAINKLPPVEDPGTGTEPGPTPGPGPGPIPGPDPL